MKLNFYLSALPILKWITLVMDNLLKKLSSIILKMQSSTRFFFVKELKLRVMFRMLHFLCIHNNSYYWDRVLWSCLESDLEAQSSVHAERWWKGRETWAFVSAHTTWWYSYQEEGDPHLSFVCTADLLMEVESLLNWGVESRECPVSYLLQIGFGHWGQICNSSLIVLSGFLEGVEVLGLSGSFHCSVSWSLCDRPKCSISVFQFPKYGKGNTVLPYQMCCRQKAMYDWKMLQFYTDAF